MDQQSPLEQPGLGHNLPDWAAEESARLAREHAGLEADVTALLAEARQAPATVENEEAADIYTRLIKRLRDLGKRVEAMRESEKAPHLRRANACDNFFFRMAGRLERRKPTDAPGGVDVLSNRLHDYNQKRLAEEQARRDAAARAAKAEADRLARERAEAERQQREAEAAAARARNEAVIAERRAEAERLAAATAMARDVEQAARDKAADADADAKAKPADMVRERHASGALNTMKQVWHVEITDSMALDPVALWPFVKEDHKLQALKAWAQVTQHRRPMNGAIIEQRAETSVR